MAAPHDIPAPERLIQFCGADCGPCETYQLFLAGDATGLVDSETGYRCCWLPANYPAGRECPIKECCERHGVSYCGLCDQFDHCERMRGFYAQPGYDVLRERMLEAVHRMKGGGSGLVGDCATHGGAGSASDLTRARETPRRLDQG